MKLRAHPLMSYNGFPSWPPVWIKGGIDWEVKKLTGEVGVLRDVLRHDKLPNKCFLVIEHESERWMGCLVVGDGTFCNQIVDLLKLHVGRSMKEIGELDLSFSL